MDIKIDKNLLSFNQYEALLRVENLIKQKIQNLCFQDENNSQIQVEYGAALIKKEANETFGVSHNASFEIKNSYRIVDAVSKILKNDYRAIGIKGAFLLVKLTFSNKNSKNDFGEDIGTKNAVSLAFNPTVPRYSFESIVLTDRVRDNLMDAVKIVEYRDLIFNEWGYGEIEPYARCVINMYGPAGTGKTMCAHAIAKQVGKQILALNYSEIESKYLGEAAKNLASAFDTAKKTDSVLFFDEADSFLGKRVQNVMQSSDQALNSLRSQMLILLEKFDGIVIFATNLISNFDPAFMSRIQKHVKFELPDTVQRAEIIKKQIPSRLPISHVFSDDDLLKISEHGDGLSGREIKNAIFEMMLRHVGFGEPYLFKVEDFSEALRLKVESNKEIEEEKNRSTKEKILKRLAEKSQSESVQAQ